MYKRTEESYVGVELEHDVYEIDLDYTLDNFEDLKTFMRQLLIESSKYSGAHLHIDELFSGDGFEQLCLVSGGVPRDFLSLFVRLANNVLLVDKGLIGKIQVNEESIANIPSKLDALKRDSGDEDQILEEYLNAIKNKVYNEKRTNAFLVAKADIDQFPQVKQAIRELVDLRLIHIIDKNTSSAPSDGRRYEAYLLDVGLYDNSRPRSFNQIQPGAADSKSRKDAIRAAPRISLFDLELAMTKWHQYELFVTDENY